VQINNLVHKGNGIVTSLTFDAVIGQK
jgi:hypothetical protein